MLRHKATTAQLDKTYRNISEEGRGTHNFYVQQKRSNNRKLIEVILFFIILALLIVLAFAVVDGHGYFQQWHDLFTTFMHHKPGKINDNEIH